MRSSILRTMGLHKQFTLNHTTITILDHITVSFACDHTYALMGFSGSGKSTLMHLLAGLDIPSQGHILFNEHDINTLTIRQKQQYLNQSIGVMFQQSYLIPELSALENIIVPGLIQKKSFTQCKQEALSLLAYINLMDKKDSSIRSLSGGQQQRVALARALFNKPAFLIADEPTGNLDTATSLDMIHLLLDCHKKWSMGLIISTHDKDVARQMQTIYHLENGQLKENDKRGGRLQNNAI